MLGTPDIRGSLSTAILRARAADLKTAVDRVYTAASKIGFEGAHYRTDFPNTDDARFRGHTVLDGRQTHLLPVEAPKVP